jgi:hypothetical protein
MHGERERKNVERWHDEGITRCAIKQAEKRQVFHERKGVESVTNSDGECTAGTLKSLHEQEAERERERERERRGDGATYREVEEVDDGPSGARGASAEGEDEEPSEEDDGDVGSPDAGVVEPRRVLGQICGRIRHHCVLKAMAAAAASRRRRRRNKLRHRFCAQWRGEDDDDEDDDEDDDGEGSSARRAQVF